MQTKSIRFEETAEGFALVPTTRNYTADAGQRASNIDAPIIDDPAGGSVKGTPLVLRVEAAGEPVKTGVVRLMAKASCQFPQVQSTALVGPGAYFNGILDGFSTHRVIALPKNLQLVLSGRIAVPDHIRAALAALVMTAIHESDQCLLGRAASKPTTSAGKSHWLVSDFLNEFCDIRNPLIRGCMGQPLLDVNNGVYGYDVA